MIDSPISSVSDARSSLWTRKTLLAIVILWLALDLSLMIIGSTLHAAWLGTFGVISIFYSYVGIPILFVVWLFMGITDRTKKVISGDRLPGDEKFNIGEVIIVALIFLAGVIIPAFLGNNYTASHPGAVSPPIYISVIGFWTNLTAFLFAVALFRRRSKWTRFAAVILVILAGLYFSVLLAGYMLSGFIG